MTLQVREKQQKPQASRDEITLSELADVLSRRRRVFLLCVAVGILVAVLLSLVLPTRYEAVARLTVDFAQSQSAGMEALAQAAGVADPTKLQTQVSILETDSLAWEVVRTLRLDQKADALPRHFGIGGVMCQASASQSFDDTSPDCRRLILDEFHKRLHVQMLPRTEILEIRYRSRSRPLSAQVVNTLAALYEERNFQSKYDAALRASGWLGRQLAQVRKDAEASELRYLQYQKQTGIVGLEGNQNLDIAQLNNLNQHLVNAEADRIIQEARYRTAQTGDPEALVSIAQGTTLQALHAEQIALENQYAELDAKYGDAYPRVLQMKEQLAKAREATQTELQHTREKIRNDYEAAQKNEQLMGAALEEQKQKLFGSNEAGVKLALLQRDAAANNDLYEQVVKRVRTGNVMAGAGESEITMIDPATVPSRPSEPHFGLNLAGGIFIGALCGFAMCGILEGLDGKIGTLSDVAELCPLPGVGLIPRLDEREPEAGAPNAAARARIAVLDAPQSSTADAYRSLRSALLHSNGAAVPQIVMVAGPRAGEGATECSANLAVSLAQRNERVLLVDADLRHATLSRWLRMQGDGGLVAALNEQAVAPSLRPLPDLPALQVLSAGRPQANSADMLDSAAMRQLLAVWRTQFDYIVLDAPHVLDLSDAVVLSTLADTSVMVVRAGSGRRSDVRRVKAIFDGVGSHLSGAVVTDVRVSTVEPLREEVGHA